MKVLLATGNRGKVAEFREILEPLGMSIVTPPDLGLDAEVEETGETFAENALLKAQAFRRFFSGPVLADDSGLEVDALNGEPGVRTARYAGPGADSAANRKKLIAALSGLPDASRRGARFVCHLTWLDPGGEVLEFRGECRGRIAEAEKGEGGFGYDALFIPEGETRTFAEIPSAEKHRYSHRGRASAALAAYWSERGHREQG